jgi:hypothetical protein
MRGGEIARIMAYSPFTPLDAILNCELSGGKEPKLANELPGPGCEGWAAEPGGSHPER